MESTSTATEHFARPAAPVALQTSPLARVARSGFSTAGMLLLELVELGLILLIVDLLLAEYVLSRNPYVDHGYGVLPLLVVLVVVQYGLVAGELVVRHRVRERGLTLPIGFLPLGRTVRLVVLLIAATLVMIPKLVVYFLLLTIGVPIFAVLARTVGGWSLRLIDYFDVLLEPLEHVLNSLFNLLHFNKIETRTSCFTTVFNLWLTLWCLNH